MANTSLARSGSEAARERIPVYRPDLSGNERRYVLECVDTTWVSSIGAFVERFEKAIAEVAGARHAIAVSNGTVALHLALHCIDLKPGDEVIVPSFTYIASVNTIAQTGAIPVFADVRPCDWLLDVSDVEARLTSRTKAILPVHLYGTLCDMPEVCRLADRRGLYVVEDCAEALGATLNSKHAGTFGDVGTFSFFGNKTVTTGEGGAVITNSDERARRMRQVKGQGQSLTRRYWHEMAGFNYRITNIAAAIGVAQFERLPEILSRKRAIAKHYRTLLTGLPVTFQEQLPGVEPSEWLVSVLLPEGADRERLMADMDAAGVETRPVFYCAHTMPMYAQNLRLPVSEGIAARGISLPSFPGLTDEQVNRVADTLGTALQRQHFT